MRVLITGGCGYIGFSLIEQLDATNEITEIVIYDNLSRNIYPVFFAKFSEKVRFIQGDILDERKLEKAMRSIDCVVHLAAKVNSPLSDIETQHYDQINNWGTSILVNLVEKSAVEKIIYLSSGVVYGNTKNELATVDFPVNPINHYGKSKLLGEEHTLRLKDKISTYILRVGNVFGVNPAIRMDTVMNKFIFRAIFNDQVMILGDGSQIRSFINVEVLARKLKKYILQEGTISKIANVSTFNYSIEEIAYFMKENLFPDLQIRYLNENNSYWGYGLQNGGSLSKEQLEIDFIANLKILKNNFTIK